MEHDVSPFVFHSPAAFRASPIKERSFPLNLVKRRHTGDFQRLDDLWSSLGCALGRALSFEHGKTLTFLVPRAHIEAYSALYAEGVINLDLLFLLVE